MRILLHSDDLLFGSRLQAELSAAGHEVRSTGGELPDAGADLILADLTAHATARIEQLRELAARPPVLAFYSHVEADVRASAEAAGFERVVPRSRIAREATALVNAVTGS